MQSPDHKSTGVSDSSILGCRWDTRGVTKAVLVQQHQALDFLEQHYERVRLLGKGSFGTVHLVRDRRTGDERVCKEVSFEGAPPQLLQLTRREIQLLADLDHPNIVKLYEYADDSQRSCISLILEYVTCGDCKGLLVKYPGGLSEPFVGRIIYQSLVALAYCHQHFVIHRDIKPENMMISRSGWGDPVFKLVDFGMAAQARTATEPLGTPPYTAPEVLSKMGYSAKADIWSVGVSAIELLTGSLPFGGFQDHGGAIEPLFALIRQYQSYSDLEPRMCSLRGWQECSQEGSSFFALLLSARPEERPHAHEALEDPWPDLHKVNPKGLTGDMLKSLANYAGAPSPVRCCLLAISVRTNIHDRERLGSAFLASDIDGDGLISRDDLASAIEAAKYWWDPDVDIDALVRHANLDHSEGINYSEFVAACLYSRMGSLGKLMDAAFTALDSDRDGKVSVREIRDLFRERDAQVLLRLPQDRPFTRSEWNICLSKSCMAEGGTSPGETTGGFSNFIGSLNCSSGANIRTMSMDTEACVNTHAGNLVQSRYDSIESQSDSERSSGCTTQ